MPGRRLLDTDAAKTIARKLGAEVPEGRRHTIAKIQIDGVNIGQYGIARHRNAIHNHIPRQIKVSREVALDIARCHLGLADYTAVLIEKGILPAPEGEQGRRNGC